MRVLLKSLGTLLVVATVFVAATYAYSRYDQWLNYTAVQARVIDIDAGCYLTRTEVESSGSKTLKITTTKTNEVNCSLARRSSTTFGNYSSFNLQQTYYATFEFELDGVKHQSRHAQSMKYDGKSLEVGDVVEILIRHGNPTESKPSW